MKTEHDSYFLEKARKKKLNPHNFYPEFLSLQRCLKNEEKYNDLKNKISKSKLILGKIVNERQNKEYGRPALDIMKEAMSSHENFRKTI